MGLFNKEKITSINLTIYSFGELEDLITKMSELLKEGYKIGSISDFTYDYHYTTKPSEPMFTTELIKRIGV